MLDMGDDGSFTELEIGGYCGKSHYRWWVNAPETWEVLEEIGNEIYDSFYTQSPKTLGITMSSNPNN